MVELPERIDRDEADGGAFLAPWHGTHFRFYVIAQKVQPPIGTYEGTRQRGTVPFAFARFDAACADPGCLIRCEDGFGGQIEGLTEIQENIDQGSVVGAGASALRNQYDQWSFRSLRFDTVHFDYVPPIVLILA